MILDIAEGMGARWRQAGSIHRGAIASQTKQKGIHPPRLGSRGTEKKGKNKMEQYDYLRAVINDAKAAIEDLDEEEKKELAKLDKDEKKEYLYNLFWNSDRVTGNASGSYTFTAWKAEENLCHNGDLIEEMAGCFGYSLNDLANLGSEGVDVAIRCYVLPQAIDRALEEEEEK